MLALLEKHWRAAGVLLALAIVLGYAAHFEGRIAEKDVVIRQQAEKIGTMVGFISPADYQRALTDQQAGFTRVAATYQETIRVLSSRPGPGGSVTSVVERIIERPVSPPPAGSPPGTRPIAAPPGTPLIPPVEAPAARAAAVERIIAHLDAGSLLAKCWPSQDAPDQLELLRAPSGALSSTSPCVSAVDDTVHLQTPATGALTGRGGLHLSYHVAIPSFTFLGGPLGVSGIVGGVYTNIAWGGVYRIGPGYTFGTAGSCSGFVPCGGVFTWEKPVVGF